MTKGVPIVGDQWNVISRLGKTTIERDGTMMSKGTPYTQIITKTPMLVEGAVVTLEAAGWHDRISLGISGGATGGEIDTRHMIRLELNGFGLVHVGRDIGGNCIDETAFVEAKDHLLAFSESATNKRLQMRVVRSTVRAAVGFFDWMKSFIWSDAGPSHDDFEMMLQYKIGNDGENQWVDASAFPASVMKAPDGSVGLYICLQLFRNKTKTGRITKPVLFTKKETANATKRPRDPEETTPETATTAAPAKSPKTKLAKVLSRGTKTPKSPAKAPKSPAKTPKKAKKDKEQKSEKKKSGAVAKSPLKRLKVS